MSLRSYLILMALATALAWLSWAVVLNGIDPTRSGVFGFLLFYITLAVALFGTFSILDLLIRLWRAKDIPAPRLVLIAFRHGILFSLLCISSILLLSQGWFRWWTMFLVVLITAFFELVFLTSRRA